MRTCKNCTHFGATDREMFCILHMRSADESDIACNRYDPRYPRWIGWTMAMIIGIILWILILVSIIFFVRECRAEDGWERVITITTETHIVSDEGMYNCIECRGRGYGGYYYTDKTTGKHIIYILGEKHGDKIRPKRWIDLGHETHHAYADVDDNILNPDKYPWWIHDQSQSTPSAPPGIDLFNNGIPRPTR